MRRSTSISLFSCFFLLLVRRPPPSSGYVSISVSLPLFPASTGLLVFVFTKTLVALTLFYRYILKFYCKRYNISSKSISSSYLLRYMCVPLSFFLSFLEGLLPCPQCQSSLTFTHIFIIRTIFIKILNYYRAGHPVIAINTTYLVL